jgi:ubiquitin C-terminal hydrolase
MSELECSICNKKRVKFETFTVLDINVTRHSLRNKDGDFTLSLLLQEFSKVEKLE